MTQTDVQMCMMLAQHVGIRMIDNGDGTVSYGNTVTADADRVFLNLKGEEKRRHKEVRRCST